MALGFLLGMGLATPALAFEIGDLITPGVEAHGDIEAVVSKFAEQDDVITSFIVNPNLAAVGDAIGSVFATQADVDALWQKINPKYVSEATTPDIEEFIFIEVGDKYRIANDADANADGVNVGQKIVMARTATSADVMAGVMINSDIVDFTKMKFGHGVEGDSVIIGGNYAELGQIVFDRIATATDVTNKVYSNGTVVALGDAVFAGKVVEVGTDTYYNTDGSEVIFTRDFATFKLATEEDVNISTEETIPGTKDLGIGDKIVTGAFNMVNGVEATFNQWIGERIADSSDVDAIVLGDDGEPVVIGDVISARTATYADVASGAYIDPTVLKTGDLVFEGYADADDVAAKKLTGVEFVKVGDTIFSRSATQEDVDAEILTGDRIIKFSELIPGAIVVDAAFLEANPNFKIGDKTVVDGDVIFLSVDAKTASAAIPPVFYTATNAIDDKFIKMAADSGLNEEEAAVFKVAIQDMSPNVSDLNRLKVLDLFTNPDIENSTVELSEIDNKDALIAGFALSHDELAFNAYSDAVHEVAAGKMTATDFRTKITPDVSSGAAVAGVGSSVVTSSINNHQGNIIANSGNYGPKNISVASLSGDTGVASGSTSMNTSVWGEMFVSDSAMGMRDGVAGYDANAGGFTLGVDAVVDPALTVGFAMSYADINVNGNSIANSKTETDQFQGTLYGVMMMEDFFVNGSVAYAVSSSDTSRTTFGGTAKGSYSTNIYSVDLGVGMPVSNGNMLITPQIGISYSSINPNSYSETGSAALNVSAENMSMLGIKAGIAVDTKLKLNAGTLVPKLRLIADWDILRERAESTASWVSTGITIATTSGPKPSALGGVVGLGFDYVSDDGAYVLSLDYDLTTKSNFTSHAGSAKVRFNF